MKTYCIQLNSVWENKPASHARVLGLLEAHPPEPGSLVLLPEMFATGFSMDVAAITDTANDETKMFLAATAAKYDIYLQGGVVTTAPDGRGRNESATFAPDGREIARYHKLHPFGYGGETACYASGEQLVQFNWGEVNVAPFICYDLRFPEIFRAAVRLGAQLYTVIANWPEPRESHWIALLQARAIENQAYVAGVNRCGSDPNLHYSGRSLIIDPRGNILADAGNEETVIEAEIDLQELQDYRQHFPALKDMRNV